MRRHQALQLGIKPMPLEYAYLLLIDQEPGALLEDGGEPIGGGATLILASDLKHCVHDTYCVLVRARIVVKYSEHGGGCLRALAVRFLQVFGFQGFRRNDIGLSDSSRAQRDYYHSPVMNQQ